MGRCCSGRIEPYFDVDGVGDVGEVAGVAGDDGGLVADGGGDDDGIHDVSGAGGRAGDAGGAAGRLVVGGEDVAAFEDPGDLVLGPAAPGLGQQDDRDDRADVRAGHLVVQGEEVGVAPFGGGPASRSTSRSWPGRCSCPATARSSASTPSATTAPGNSARSPTRRAGPAGRTPPPAMSPSYRNSSVAQVPELDMDVKSWHAAAQTDSRWRAGSRRWRLLLNSQRPSLRLAPGFAQPSR